MLRNADATWSRFSWQGDPLFSVWAEITVGPWSVDAFLAGPRVRTDSRYAEATVSSLLGAGFELLASFAAPTTVSCCRHTMRPIYGARFRVLGSVERNPHFVER